ncbi:SDR family NAD(P)-dependent oxidoreductase [Haladaptatus sp. R4]|uniref:SDR family NAD(P)-dependent oxidoreductase n=1 Tax=Haladaptatus sp. R4 TaxID=1679489 RepID=UPI0009EEB6E1|nr:SDR family NAD(P)-dependent oxidoreductase [Haladaptatus sp. R4]
MTTLSSKRVLITGGCGSIGSALVRRVLQDGPELVRVIDNDEGRLHWMETKLGRQYPRQLKTSYKDVREFHEMVEAMDGIDVVFHTAALKHVGIVERDPFQAVKTNVEGTENVVHAAMETDVEAVIAVSTDKASNPVSAMGATKLLSERLTVAANENSRDTRFGCVRFGNVLGTRGSVVPVFIEQIRAGGPITVTDAEMTRFVMRPEDAAEFVVETYGATDGGEVAVRKMPAFKLGTLADALREKYATQFGHRPEEIPTRIVGSGPTERYHEKLVSEDEVKHAVEEDTRFVLYPNEGSMPDDDAGRSLAGEYTSEDARELSKTELLAMLDGMDGKLQTVGAPVERRS